MAVLDHGTGEDSATSHIIYHEEGNDGYIIPRFLNLAPGYPTKTAAPNMAVCSSSNGILLVYVIQTENYYILNPFIKNSMKPLPIFPRQPPFGYNSSFAVVAMNESTVDVLFLLGPFDDDHYEADVFSSDPDCWSTVNITNEKRSRGVPDTGVSCNRNVFFLVDSFHQMQVLQIDIVKGAHSFIQLPYNGSVNGEDSIRVQLGRHGSMLGAVIVNETKRKVEVCLLKQDMEGTCWFLQCMVEVVYMGHDYNNVSVTAPGGLMAIRCRKMPMPMRFESSKVEVPLWVDGRIVMVEKSAEHEGGALRIIQQPQSLPSCVVWGVPYVMSQARLLYGILSHY